MSLLPRMTGLAPLSKKYLRQTADPNGLRRLRLAYAHIGANPEIRTSWTPESAVHIGRLYAKTWGQIPQLGRLKPRYCLPTVAIVCELFGSYLQYIQAIEKED